MNLHLDPCTLTALLATLGALVLVGVGAGLLGAGVLSRVPAWTGPASGPPANHNLLVIIGGAVAVLAAGGLGYLAENSCAVVSAQCNQALSGSTLNLIANPAFAAGRDKTSPLDGWQVQGTLGTDAPQGWIAPAPNTDVDSARIWVRPGAHYCFAVDMAGAGQGQVVVAWDDIHLDELDTTVVPPPGVGRDLRGEVVAPEGAAYARFRLHTIDGAPRYHAPVLAEGGVRLEQWPNGAAAALAFSFDWESTMGSPIHSRTEHDLAYARQRGRNMRQGADILLDYFQQNHIQATFYANGYNLLDGNTAREKFAGDPTYKYGASQGWHTTWWITNTWYSDDPYGTVQSDPDWYFGDQTDRLVAAGQEIGNHTFGHIYGRATKRAQLQADLDSWSAAAQARKLPPVHAFAFPFRSSNDLVPGFYDVLAAHGIDSVTRLFLPDLKDRYVLYGSSVYTAGLMTVVPDWLLGAEGPDLSDGGTAEVNGIAEAQSIIAENIARRGFTTFWTHPEQLVNADVRDSWRETIAAAAAARDKGDLWIAPVTTITHYWRDLAQVSVNSATNGDKLMITVSSKAAEPLEGVTLTLPRPAAEVRIGGAVVKQQRPTQVILPRLDPTAPIQVEVTLSAGGSR